MEKDEWIDTKKEYEIDESGVPKLKKVTSELKKKGFERKDLLDLIFKSIGVIAIGFPIYMVSVQQRAAIKSKRAEQQSEIIIKIASEFKSIQTSDITDSGFQKAKGRLSNELSTKVSLFFNGDLSKEFEDINGTISLYDKVATNSNIAIKLYNVENSLGSHLSSLSEPITQADIEKEQLDQLTELDSLFTDLLVSKNQLERTKESVAVSDTGINEIIKHSIDLNRMFFPGYSKIKDNCDFIIRAIEGNNLKDRSIVDKCKMLDDQINALNSLYGSEKEKVDIAYKIIKEQFLASLFLKCRGLLTNMRQSNKLLDQ